MKCQKCTKAATLHITEVVSDDQFEELHLCEECANKYLYEPQQKGTAQKGSDTGPIEEADEAGSLNQRECPVLRHQVCRVSQFRPARLPPRLHGVSRGTGSAAREHPRRDQALRQVAATLAPEQADSVGVDLTAKTASASGDEGGVRGSGPHPRPDSPARRGVNRSWAQRVAWQAWPIVL